MKLRRSTLVVILLLTVTPVTSLASAAISEPPRVVVSFADLNVARSEGAYKLYKRIQRAAQIVCRSFESRDVARTVQFRTCVAEAVARAVADAELRTGARILARAEPRLNR